MRNSIIAYLFTALALAATSALADGSASAGRKVFKECRSCHSVQEGKYDTFGPNLYQVVGREAGSAPEYNYSPVLKNSDIVWTVVTLDRWLADPQAFLTGSEMEYILESAKDRADVIAYLIAAGRR